MDMRYCERWMNDRRVLRLNDLEHRGFVLAMTWSVSNRTDGVITAGDLPYLPQPVTRETLEALCRAGLASEELAGDEVVWVMTDYSTSQTSRAEFDSMTAAREQKKIAARNRRSTNRVGEGGPEFSDVPVTTQASASASASASAQGQEKDKSAGTKEVSGDSEPATSWPVAAIPGEVDPDTFDWLSREVA